MNRVVSCYQTMLLQQTCLVCLLADTSQAYLLLLDVFKQFLPRSIWGFASVIKRHEHFLPLGVFLLFIYLFESVLCEWWAEMSFF